MSEQDRSDLEFVAEQAWANAPIDSMQGVGQTEPVVLARKHKDTSIEDLTAIVEKHQRNPTRQKGVINALAIQSFIDLTMRHHKGLNTTAIYVQPNRPGSAQFTNGVVALLESVLNDTQALDLPAWRDFRIKHAILLSTPASRWFGRNGVKMEQTEFAEFIEDNILDIPAGASLLQAAVHLQAKTDITFGSAIRLDNGEVKFTYSEDLQMTSAVQLPLKFEIFIPLFENSKAGYKMTARLKYRLAQKRVTFQYDLERSERVLEDAITGVIDQLMDHFPDIVYLAQP